MLEAVLDCVAAVEDAKNRLLRREGHSPFQMVFGRDPLLPEDVLNQNPNLVVNSAIMNDDVFARLMMTRSVARMETLAFNDDVAFRRALDSRPRVLQVFNPGDRVGRSN